MPLVQKMQDCHYNTPYLPKLGNYKFIKKAGQSLVK